MFAAKVLMIVSLVPCDFRGSDDASHTSGYLCRRSGTRDFQPQVPLRGTFPAFQMVIH